MPSSYSFNDAWFSTFSNLMFLSLSLSLSFFLPLSLSLALLPLSHFLFLSLFLSLSLSLLTSHDLLTKFCSSEREIKKSESVDSKTRETTFPASWPSKSKSRRKKEKKKETRGGFFHREARIWASRHSPTQDRGEKTNHRRWKWTAKERKKGKRLRGKYRPSWGEEEENEEEEILRTCFLTQGYRYR